MSQLHHQIIDQLKSIIDKHNISIIVSGIDFLANHKDYPAVQFNIVGASYNIFVHDEYDDFKVNNPLLNLILVIRELEDYAYADDYLIWCNQHSIDASIEQVRNYHISLAKVYRETESIYGPIKSLVSDYDFELNAGIVQYLRSQ